MQVQLQVQAHTGAKGVRVSDRGGRRELAGLLLAAGCWLLAAEPAMAE